MLRSNFCDYSNAYILLKGAITATGLNNAKKRNRKLTFKNNSPFLDHTYEKNLYTVYNILCYT